VIIRFARPSRPVSGHHLLIQNVNRSGVDLPDGVSASDLRKAVRLDKDLDVRRLSDREIHPLFIELSEEERVRPGLTLEVVFDPALFTVLDQSGKPLKIDEGAVAIDLTSALRSSTKIGGTQIYLEARSFVGARTTDDLSEIVQFTLIDERGQGLQTVATVDAADIRPADLILAGDHAAPVRLLMCELDENQPSVREVREAARRAGVPLMLVPKSVGTGDTWLQDQFQLACAAGAGTRMPVIVHLPRMVNDGALLPTTPNLKNFVDRYFASDGLGLLNDLWAAKITVGEGSSDAMVLTVAQSYLLYKDLYYFRVLLRSILRLIGKVDSTEKANLTMVNARDLYAVRLAINDYYRKLSAYTKVDDATRATINGFSAVITAVSSVDGGNIAGLATTPEGMLLSIRAGEKVKQFAYSEDNKQDLNDLLDGLDRLHSPANYGGNIEVSPPMSGLPDGKILTGTVTSAAVTTLLESCAPAQPLGSAYTGWLKVGHIDELMTFVRDPSAPQGFAICRASPRLAITMLERLQEAQAGGVLVTRALRGKKWRHEGLADVRYHELPPRFYLAYVANADQRYDVAIFAKGIPPDAKTTYFHSAYRDDRRFMVFGSAHEINAHYAAFITCADLVNQLKVTNRAAEDLFLTGKLSFADDVYYAHYATSEAYKKQVVPGILTKVLDREFKGTPVHRLPVLFDHVDDFAHGSTSAVTPDLVNLQTLGQHVLVPKPYGPRMRPTDAVRWLREFLDAWDDPKLASYVRRTVDERWIDREGLQVTHHWTKAGERVAVAQPDRRPSELDPDFKEMWRAIYQSIYASFSLFDIPSYYEIVQYKTRYTNHPIMVDEDLGYLANCFKDGFDAFKNYPVDYCQGDDEKSHPKEDEYDRQIEKVMDTIDKANPGVFDDQGRIIAKDWTRITIPENTVDVFQLYAHALLTMLGVTVQWVDSWYYHVHDGGIHCGTNVLRTP
jgi:hypothetical protein